VRGIEVSFVDAFALAFIFATDKVRIPFSVIIAFSIYLAAYAISTFAAQQWEPAIFYGWQLLRTVILFVAIARVCAADTRTAIALVGGLGTGLILEAGYVAYQYKAGVARPGGTFGTSNFMGLTIDFVVYPALALMLGTRRTLWPIATVIAGLIVAVLGASRATLGLCIIGIILTILLSIVRRSTPRKFGFAGGLALLLIASTPVVLWAASRRSAEVLASSDAERNAMKEAAAMIIAEHPFGVGANQYVVVANTGGYSQRAGVAWNEQNRAAPVHDTYYLIAAEMGVLGLIGFVTTLGCFIFIGFATLRRKGSEVTELAPGLLAALLVSAVHISFEFVFMDFTLHYLYAMAAGMLVAVAIQSKKPARKTVRVPPASAAVPRLS
jgi:O-antigen ligase